jgi:MarR family transcriptional regulator, transcriptional regulator for hemolysin
MVGLLDELEDKGYVARQRHPRDRRAFLVHPTDSGRAAKAAAVRILDEQQRRFLAPLTPAERRQLAACSGGCTGGPRQSGDARLVAAADRSTDAEPPQAGSLVRVQIECHRTLIQWPCGQGRWRK